VGLACDGGDRRDVAAEIKTQLIVKRRVYRVRRADHEKRVAVLWCLYDRFGAKVAARARPVVYDERLAEPL
jgi:hypothetical protein